MHLNALAGKLTHFHMRIEKMAKEQNHALDPTCRTSTECAKHQTKPNKPSSRRQNLQWCCLHTRLGYPPGMLHRGNLLQHCSQPGGMLPALLTAIADKHTLALLASMECGHSQRNKPNPFSLTPIRVSHPTKLRSIDSNPFGKPCCVSIITA